MPDVYHARTGHVLPSSNSSIQKQLVKTMEYAENNQMEINHKKSKVMIFNPCRTKDFMPQLELDNHELDIRIRKTKTQTTPCQRRRDIAHSIQGGKFKQHLQSKNTAITRISKVKIEDSDQAK